MPSRFKLTILPAVVYLLTLAQTHAQQPAFFHLSTAEGLSDNQVNSVCRDRNGLLWIGTAEGLNSFDGNTVTAYYKEQHAAIASNYIQQVICDQHNRIWLRTYGSAITLLDEKRRFRSFPVGEAADSSDIRLMLQTRSRGVVVLKGQYHYVFNDTAFRLLTWPGDTLIPATIQGFSRLDEDKTIYRGNNRLGEDKIIYCGNNRLVIVDYSQLKILANIPLNRVEVAVQLNSHELIAFASGSNTLYRINLDTKKIVREYPNLRDQYGQPLPVDLRDMCRIAENKIVLTSRFSGAYHFDAANGQLQRWHHDPVDNRSLGADNTGSTLYDTSGYLFITTRTSGLHYVNLKQPAALYKSFFKTAKGEVFDGFIQAITTATDGTVWLGTQDRLVQWNRQNNQSTFIDYRLPDGTALNGNETIRALLFDAQHRLWTGTSRHGILLLNKNKITIGHLKPNRSNSANGLPSGWINCLRADKAGNIWAGTLRGICRVNSNNLQVERFSTHPVLAPVSDIACNTLWFDKTGRLWIGTNTGAWCYCSETQTLKRYTEADGLSHNKVLSFNEDNNGSIYIGTAYGLSVLGKEGSIKKYNRTNGLRNDKCEGILRDAEGFLWIGNQNSLVRFDPVLQHFAVYEEGIGLMHSGFRMRCCYKSNEGELFWGSDKGLTCFFPSQLNATTTALHPSVNGLYVNDTVYRVSTYDSLLFPFTNAVYSFSFSSGELSGSKKIQYLYRLAGYETAWNRPLTYGQAAYRALEPGVYRFELKASRDGKNWYNASYPIALTVLKPWWRQWWFRGASIAVLAVFAWSLYHYLGKKKKEAEIQKMIGYFIRTEYEHSSVEELLWDIAYNCISRLDFEDCVIYLLDEERQVLVQKAACGPKSPVAFEILNPIEIPVGKGIVGEVAVSGKAIIVNNTTKDKRYIVDDEKRLSEISVPLIHEGKVIGIIDSENKRRNFFTGHHLQTLQAIASVCSAKISRAMALDAMKKSKLEVMELNMKMAESKFLNLRLQMNPHFLFNSLSSIQNLIVSQQTTRAYKYLTLFSNFLRSLLDHAEKNFITLDEELSMLRMYIQLESLRFDKSFQYEITVDENLDNDEVLVPSLMIQPFAENAIWHGLMHRKGDKKLSISFANNTEEYLTCIIEDNGIGRDKARAIRQKKISSVMHESKGIKIIEERLTLLQQKTGKPTAFEIQDLFNEAGPAGTKIIITIPYYNPEEI